MKSVVYVDVLLLVNFVIAVVLLTGAGRLCGAIPTPGRIILGSGAAALASLSLLAPEWPLLIQLVYKLAAMVCSAAAAYPKAKGRRRIQLCCWYFLLNLTLCGVVAAGIEYGGTIGLETNNLAVYCAVSPRLLLACVAGVYALLKLLLVCFERTAAEMFCISGELFGCDFAVMAFEDTGLQLTASFSSLPVILVCRRALKQMCLPEELRCFLTTDAAGQGAVPKPEWGLRLVPYQTAEGNGVFPAVQAKKIVLKSKNGTMRCAGAWVAVCAQPFVNGCDAAFGTGLRMAADIEGEGKQWGFQWL